MTEKKERKYEIAFLLPQEKDIETLKEILASHDANITLDPIVRHTKLAYKIKGRGSAYFGYLHAEIDPSSVPAMNNALNLEESVLRYLIIQPPTQRKSESGSRTSKEGTAKEKRQKSEESDSEEKSSSGRLTNEALQERLEEIMN